VPSCSIAFGAGADKVQLAIDGGRPVALPATIKVTSGRHVLAIRRGATTETRTELLVCGQIDALDLSAPPRPR
jgi:hypothetical protein